MPLYDYECQSCGKITEDYAPMSECNKPIDCECGKMMEKIITRGATSLASKERYSNTMGVNPSKIGKAMKDFPGSEYTPDGRLIIKSRADKMRKMAQRGYVEYE